MKTFFIYLSLFLPTGGKADICMSCAVKNPLSCTMDIQQDELDQDLMDYSHQILYCIMA